MKQSEIERLLPGIFQRTSVHDPVTLRGSPLYALLEVMAGMHEPDERMLATLSTYFNPSQAEPEFVNYLAAWVDLGQLLQSPLTGEWLPQLPIDPGRLRALVAGASVLSQRRGTAEALLFYLQTATGVSGFHIEERVNGSDDRLIPFHIRIIAPKEAAPYRNVVKRIVQLEKPVYVTAEVQFQA
jgi:hypothetical protein